MRKLPSTGKIKFQLLTVEGHLGKYTSKAGIGYKAAVRGDLGLLCRTYKEIGAF